MIGECGVASPVVAMFARGAVATGGATTGIANAIVGGGEATCASGHVVLTATQPSAVVRRRVVAGLVGRPWIRVPAPCECRQPAVRKPRCLRVEGGEGRMEGGIAVDEEGWVAIEAVEVARGAVSVGVVLTGVVGDAVTVGRPAGVGVVLPAPDLAVLRGCARFAAVCPAGRRSI